MSGVFRAGGGAAGAGPTAPGARPEDRLAALGLVLPPLRKAAGNYRGFMLAGDLLFLAGQGADGWTGRVGADLPVERARLAARDCTLNLLAQTRAALGSLDRVRQVVKVLGFVACTEDFRDTPAVLDGASDLLVAVFGEQAGAHGRSAVGVQALPKGFAVEIEMVLQVNP